MSTAAAAKLETGLVHVERMRVEDRHTVPHVARDWPGFADMPEVLATAIMIGFIEQTCIQCVRPFLAEGQHSVGTAVDVTHSAPTPVGLTISARVELVEVTRRRLVFSVLVDDGHGVIGAGRHARALIDLHRFNRSAAARKA